MSNFPLHPEEAVLVRLVDGELSMAEAREVETHLAGCPACRAETDELRATLADCRQYRSEVLAKLLPPPPEPWADLRREFSRIDRSLAAAERTHWWHAPVLRWGAAMAAAAALTIGLWREFRETPSVHAATLLRKAEAAAAARPPARHRLLFRTKSLQFTRLAGMAGTLPQEPQSPALEALFSEAHWDWNDPLSARAFATWRAPLPENARTDSVTAAADTTRIRTEASEGPLASASLTLRSGDLSPLEGRLEFRNQEWVEMTEIPDTAPQSDAVPGPPRAAEPGATHSSETAGSTPALPENALLASELHTILKLHDLKADLGDHVTVTNAGGRILVNGEGLAPERRQQIEAALNGIPNVAVQFAEPAATLPNAPAITAPAQTGASSGIVARVEKQLGGRPQFERFSSQMLDWSDDAMARAYALRNLAEHFPPAKEASLEAADRRALRAAAREEAAALATVTGKMSRTLDPILNALGGEASAAGPAADGWQTAAEDLLRAAQRADRNLSILLGATSAGDAGFSPSDLRHDLARVVADSALCQRLLAQE